MREGEDDPYRNRSTYWLGELRHRDPTSRRVEESRIDLTYQFTRRSGLANTRCLARGPDDSMWFILLQFPSDEHLVDVLALRTQP